VGSEDTRLEGNHRMAKAWGFTWDKSFFATAVVGLEREFTLLRGGEF